MMGFRVLDMNSYRRKSHFEYFSSLPYPYVGVTVNVDITDFAAGIKGRGLPFFLSFCYCVSRAANAVPEFRQRISGAGIIEFGNCRTSHTVALKEGTYCYCTLNSAMSFEEYLPYAVKKQENARKERKTEDEEEDGKELIFISTLPWLSYTTLTQPVPIPADSNPRITWGKYFTQDGRKLMPVTVLCNHALVDGLHLSQFFEALERQMKETDISLVR